MRIAVMGAGGVGGYFGAKLAQAGNRVAFIARGRHLAAMRERGLTVKSSTGDFHLAKPEVTDDPATIGPVDVVMFTVKLWDTETAARQCAPLVREGGVVIPFQNGVESVERIGGVLGREHVMGGVAFIAATIAEPGVIAQTGTMARLQFGVTMPSQQGAAEAFAAACRDARIHAEIAPDIRVALRAKGVALADDYVARQLAFGDGLPHEMTSSMANDLAAGNRLEAPWLAGGVVRMAQESNIAAPVNATIYAALKAYVDGAAR